MPWYRITIWWTERSGQKAARGIRLYNVSDIEVMQKNMEMLADKMFGRSNVVAVAVEMLSEKSFAVREHLAGIERRREARRKEYKPPRDPRG